MVPRVIIHLRIENREPPRGQLWAEGHPPRPFSGWLDLLRLLSELVERRRDGRPAP